MGRIVLDPPKNPGAKAHEEPLFLNCVAYGEAAEIFLKMKQGASVHAVGRLTSRPRTTKGRKWPNPTLMIDVIAQVERSEYDDEGASVEAADDIPDS